MEEEAGTGKVAVFIFCQVFTRFTSIVKLGQDIVLSASVVHRWESCGLEPPASPRTAREQHRLAARDLEKKMFHALVCSTCQDQLVPEAWQCRQGHFTCGLCFDRKNMGRDVEESEEEEEEEERRDVVGALRRSLSSMLSLNSRNTRDTSLASMTTVASVISVAGLREELATLAEEDEEEFEHKSFSKYRIDEIDFFLDTIEVRGDVIACYADYNNEGKSIFYDPDIEALQRENKGKPVEKKTSEEDFLYKDEKNSVKLAFMERLEKEGAIASLRRTLVDIVETVEADTNPTWAKYKLDELDFFLGGTDIRKDAIGYYPDYNNDFKSIFVNGLGSEAESGIEGSDSSLDSSEETDGEGGGPRVTRCAICDEFIYKRNLQVEAVAKVFFDV